MGNHTVGIPTEAGDGTGRGIPAPPGAITRHRQCYRRFVRQLLVRLDDDLHLGLRERAAAEGRSVNALVNEVLTAAVEGRAGRREHLRRKAERSGVLAGAPPAAGGEE